MANHLTHSRKLHILLWGLASVPSVVAVFTELNKATLIWYMRIVDFMDLIFMAPFYIFSLLSIQSLIFQEKEKPAYWISNAFILIFIYGHAMHLTANTINTFSTEIRGYSTVIPKDTLALIYFFDENLGHWLLFGAYFGILGIWMSEDRIIDLRNWKSVIPGIFLGLFLSFSIIESSHPWIGVIAIFVISIVPVIRARFEQTSIKKIWENHPMIRYGLSTAFGILLGELVYIFIVGSFVQPSQLLK